MRRILTSICLRKGCRGKIWKISDKHQFGADMVRAGVVQHFGEKNKIFE